MQVMRHEVMGQQETLVHSLIFLFSRDTNG